MIIRSGTYLFIALGGFLLLVGLNIQVGWLFFIAASLFTIVGINLIYPALAIKRVAIERALNNIFENDLVTVTITVKNQWKTPIHFVNLTDHFPSQQEATPVSMFCPYLQPKESITQTYTQLAARRGRFIFQPLIVESSAPFGLIRWRRKYILPTTLTVYPMPLNLIRLSQEQAQGGMSISQAFLKTSGHSDDFWGLREYSPGDSLRFIHWRTSAKEQKLMVKEFSRAAHSYLTIFLDVDPKMHEGIGNSSSLECAIKIITSLADESLKQGNEVQIITNDGMTIRSSCRWTTLSQLAAIPAIDKYKGMPHLSPKQPLTETIQLVITQQPSIPHCMVVLPIGEEGITPKMLQLLTSLKQRRIAVAIIALFTKSFKEPSTLFQPDSQIKELLCKVSAHSWCVVQTKEGAHLI